MGQVVHARLDEESQQLLARLRKQTGLTDSSLVRRGLRVLASLHLPAGGRTIAGVGQFESGVSDLGSNKDRLKGFGG